MHFYSCLRSLLSVHDRSTGTCNHVTRDRSLLGALTQYRHTTRMSPKERQRTFSISLRCASKSWVAFHSCERFHVKRCCKFTLMRRSTVLRPDHLHMQLQAVQQAHSLACARQRVRLFTYSMRMSYRPALVLYLARQSMLCIPCHHREHHREHADPPATHQLGRPCQICALAARALLLA